MDGGRDGCYGSPCSSCESGGGEASSVGGVELGASDSCLSCCRRSSRLCLLFFLLVAVRGVSGLFLFRDGGGCRCSWICWLWLLLSSSL